MFFLATAGKKSYNGREVKSMQNVRPLGLYIHIPFCKSKCAYCDFYSLARSEARMDAYCAALKSDLIRRADAAKGYSVDTVYFGGGTPSYLGASRLASLLETVLSHYHVAPDAEITFEANPDSARDIDALKTLRAAGFNRISLGAQSFDDGELREIGRVHTASEIARAVDAAREAGFENVSLDLIYGLPRQTMPRWRENLTAALALAPEHLSCYGLKVEEGTPLYLRRESAELPDDDAQADFYLETVRLLTQHGYAQYEISNFARPGFASRHNLKYWTLGEYLGFGPGAHSDFGGRRFAVARDLSAYLAEKIVLSENAAISHRERQREYFLLGLRTVRGVCKAETDADFAAAEAVLKECAAHGLAEKTGDRWHLTPQGFLVSNAVISHVLDAI